MAKWIRFEEAGSTASGKTRFWRVVANQENQPLGLVMWDSGWRKYVFAPDNGTEFEQDCLRDIAAFIEDQTLEHKRQRAASKAQAAGPGGGR